jgi:predicted nucleic acid-binding protein
MVLVDTSVWVDHFRRRDGRLGELLENTLVLTHPFVIGELACGNLARRSEILSALHELPQVVLVDHLEVLDFLETHALQGRGLGWIDLHLLAAARLAGVPLWCRDKRLAQVARSLSLAMRED